MASAAASGIRHEIVITVTGNTDLSEAGAAYVAGVAHALIGKPYAMIGETNPVVQVTVRNASGLPLFAGPEARL
jgi:hypothetical protein